MTHFDLDTFLTEISPDAPCGEDISYDIEFLELDRLVQGTGETQVGDHIHESAEPDWKKVKSQSLKLLERSRDLRLILYLTVSKLCLEGLPGFYDGLALLRCVIERYWECCFPQLDPEDDNDPMERMNIVGSLSPPPSVMSDQDAMK
ncbi:MAG: type VI secretion system ImpA family N-terminal domain-containing protein, partial [Desulfobacteraceae bacterium]|nr:type VI secretion system ImpA family N-terminal domain-containing protein [Desulfobacteraceae bacterium]